MPSWCGLRTRGNVWPCRTRTCTTPSSARCWVSKPAAGRDAPGGRQAGGGAGGGLLVGGPAGGPASARSVGRRRRVGLLRERGCSPCPRGWASVRAWVCAQRPGFRAGTPRRGPKRNRAARWGAPGSPLAGTGAEFGVPGQSPATETRAHRQVGTETPGPGETGVCWECRSGKPAIPCTLPLAQSRKVVVPLSTNIREERACGNAALL